jgi:pyrimidine deaminase RibD-like protein
MNNDEFYIKRCIELAQKALGKTYPNPLVGSVIVHNGKSSVKDTITKQEKPCRDQCNQFC